jgi:hypothetical protein
LALTSPLTKQPAAATGAARDNWPNGSEFDAVTWGGSARVVLTMTSATANNTAIALKGSAVSTFAWPIRSCPNARAKNVPNM